MAQREGSPGPMAQGFLTTTLRHATYLVAYVIGRHIGGA